MPSAMVKLNSKLAHSMTRPVAGSRTFIAATPAGANADPEAWRLAVSFATR